MFGIDSPELLVIAIVALVVIGPKELPGLLRTWGRWMAQMRGMASEFRGHVDEMIRQTELDDVKKQLTGASDGLDLKSLDPTQQIRQHVQEGLAESPGWPCAVFCSGLSLETPFLKADRPLPKSPISDEILPRPPNSSSTTANTISQCSGLIEPM